MLPWIKKKKSLNHLLRHFKNHSTKKVKKHFNSKEIFTFHVFKETETIKTITELPKSKASTFKDIPGRIMFNSVHIYSQVLTSIFNDCVKNGSFPDILKYAYITPVSKRGDMTDKTSCRPISSLLNFSKVFEKMIYVQISLFVEPKLSKYLAGFRAKDNTQHALLKTIGTWRVIMLNKGNQVGAIIIDLSKAFDTLNLNLLLCKLKAYCLSKNALTFIQSYCYK